MEIPTALGGLPQWMGQAFAHHGFSELTPIQQAILEHSDDGRDLRIASATGSGKTVAVAMAVAEAVERACRNAAEASEQREGAPAVLVIAPTRELAAQLQGELQWIYAALRARIALVLGGGAYGQELRSLRRSPTVLVGTPGRLVDHLERGSLHLDAVDTVVLDEADQLMELGFKAELDKLLGACPKERRTMLVSATFGSAVRSLADKHQRDPLLVEGTRPGGDHADIEHVVHPISSRDQLAALCNILLAAPEERSLVFVAMRAQAAQIAASLCQHGFAAAALSGELSQAERSRTLDGFREGTTRVLVATDVAARGIDVKDVRTVVHACPPRDPEALIHRSGRTGRAGQQGTSVMMATPSDLPQVRRILQRAGVQPTWKPAPSRDEVQAILDARIVESLTAADPDDAHAVRLAEKLLQTHDATTLVAQLLGRLGAASGCVPQDVEAIAAPTPRRKQGGRGEGDFLAFELNWGRERGATPQRLVAMLCRRGRLERGQLGAIRVLDARSIVEVDAGVAEDFERAMRKPDSRDRDLRMRRLADGPAAPARGRSTLPRHLRKGAPRVGREGGRRPPRRVGGNR